ncbi:hypothetical protein TNCV_4691621 [Trichonephila clavipes]|nr:hypothetical protein TNCV_4691621 [Trichonephila clavipes]
MDLFQGEGVVTSPMVVNSHLSISVMVSPAVQGQVPHPLIVPEFLRSTSYGMTSARFCEGDTRNRWRDGQVCPDVDKELWRLGPDGSGVFWRWTSVSRCGQGTMAPWARRLGRPGGKRRKSREKRTRESGRENGRKEEERRKSERGDGKRLKESRGERVKPA